MKEMVDRNAKFVSLVIQETFYKIYISGEKKPTAMIVIKYFSKD